MISTLILNRTVQLNCTNYKKAPYLNNTLHIFINEVVFYPEIKDHELNLSRYGTCMILISF